VSYLDREGQLCYVHTKRAVGEGRDAALAGLLALVESGKWREITTP